MHTYVHNVDSAKYHKIYLHKTITGSLLKEILLVILLIPLFTTSSIYNILKTIPQFPRQIIILYAYYQLIHVPCIIAIHEKLYKAIYLFSCGFNVITTYAITVHIFKHSQHRMKTAVIRYLYFQYIFSSIQITEQSYDDEMRVFFCFCHVY